MASIFKRVNDIINASINDLIDRVEDPERMIKQAIREMEESIGQAKDGVVSAIASEKQLLHELESHRKQAADWHKKAELALETGKEDLARSALARKREIDKVIGNLEPAWDTAKATSDRLKDQLRRLEGKLEEAKRKRSMLVARQHAVQARNQMDSTLSRMDATLDAQRTFDRMEDKIGSMEARAEALAELNDSSPLEKEFLDLETDKEIEAEMAAIKQKMQQGKT
jgi:phage shock protein A